MNELEFIAESNRIEGIHRDPTDAEVNEYRRFMDLDVVTQDDLETFVQVYQPGTPIRLFEGMDVRVGHHFPPRGGGHIGAELSKLLQAANDRSMTPYQVHVWYETLHPFMDGNGRSGRMLWAWMMGGHPLGFLHHFYYQSLDGARAPSAAVRMDRFLSRS